MPDPNFIGRVKQNFNSYADAKSYVLYGITRQPLVDAAGTPLNKLSLDVTYNINPSTKIKWRDYFP